MDWFGRLCRNTGLMIHQVIKPVGSPKREVSRDVQEKKMSETTTLRRTVIEEIEVKRTKENG